MNMRIYIYIYVYIGVCIYIYIYMFQTEGLDSQNHRLCSLKNALYLFLDLFSFSPQKKKKTINQETDKGHSLFLDL